MDSKPVDVMVVNFNTASLLQPMFDALRQADSERLASYLVVDNASADNSLECLAQVCPEALLLSNKQNVGFGRANNQLLAHLKGKYALLLNTDAFVARDTLEKTVAYMDAHPDCGVLGVRLEGREGDLQPCCRYFPTPLNIFVARTGLGRLFPGLKMVDEMSWDHGSVRECDWLPGCFYLVRREVLDKVGLFDPRYFLYYEEVDHCKRVKEPAGRWCSTRIPRSCTSAAKAPSRSPNWRPPAGRSPPTRSKANCCISVSTTARRGWPCTCAWSAWATWYWRSRRC